MREIYPPPFGHPLLQRGALLRTFFIFFIFDFTNLILMDEVFLFFLVLNSTYGQSFAFFLLFSSAAIPFFQSLRIFYAYF